MTLLQLLKNALDWSDPYEDMPDYGYILEHLGLDPGTDDANVRAAIEQELAEMEPEPEGGTDGDVE